MPAPACQVAGAATRRSPDELPDDRPLASSRDELRPNDEQGVEVIVTVYGWDLKTLSHVRDLETPSRVSTASRDACRVVPDALRRRQSATQHPRSVSTTADNLLRGWEGDKPCGYPQDLLP